MDNPAPAEPSKLLGRMHVALRVRHYSNRTEQSYLDWARRYILFRDKRHPARMGGADRFDS